MSRNIDPAFPYLMEQCQRTNESEIHPGLTKRELFAAMAMQGMCGDSGRSGTFAEFAHDAVKHADALLAALEKE